MKFRATVLLSRKTATGIVVPPEVVAALSDSKKPKVVARLNGYSYRSSVSIMGGDFMLPISADVREKSGVSAGDQVEVDLALDTEVREVVIPSDLAAALDQEPVAKAKFESLSYSKKSAYVIPIEGAKTLETRERRIEKAILDLKSLV